MKHKKSWRGSSVRAKNLVRGALSRLRESSKPEARRDAWQMDQLAHQQINKALAIAKAELSQRQFAEFENWTVAIVGNQNRSSRKLGTYLTSLGLIPNELKASDLVAELRFAVDRLRRQRTDVLVFARDAAKLEKLITLHEWANAHAILETVRKRDGYSYWAIETELALKQAMEGVEALKSLIAAMSICTIGTNKFFLYFFGVRNEPAQTSSRFKTNIKKKIEDSDMSMEWQAYSKFRLYGELEIEQSTLARILACEQLTTTTDLLFTLIKITRRILGNKFVFSDEICDAAVHANEELAEITSAFGIDAMEEQRTLGTRRPDSRLIRLALRAVHAASQPGEKLIATDALEDFVVEGLASQLSTRDDGLAAEELAKTLMNFGWLSLAIELGEIGDVPSLPNLLATATARAVTPLSSIADALRISVRLLMDCPNDPAVDVLTQLIESLRAQRDGHFGAAITQLSVDHAKYSPVTEDARKVILSRYLYESDDIEECLKLCVLAGIENDRLIPMLPLAEMFQGVKWASLRHLSNSVDLAIALDHYQRIDDDRKIRTYKRYAVEELIRLHKVNQVAELPMALVEDGTEVKRIEYFFYHVCDIATLELLPGMSNSRKVWLVRSQILRCLASLHTDQEPALLLEANDIEESLKVDDGLFLLDDSKVYVDEQAILNVVNQELAADFQRYLKLVENGLGVSDSLSEVLKSFRNPSARAFQMPKNDADDLLAQLVQSMLDLFLFDPASGLDIIVGRRIRHGTIASELRGFLEAEGLIGHMQHAGGSYDLPARVAALGPDLDAKQRRIISATFARFSQSIDQLISLLRDEYFHVRSKNKARGLFDVPFGAVMFALARSIAQTCQTIEQFSKESFQIFWFFLSVQLDAARPTVEAEMKRTLSALFFKAINETRGLGACNLEFLGHLQHASEESQRRASTIAGWIRVPHANVEGNTFSIQRAVDVAGAIVTSQRPGFSPIVTSRVPDSPELDTHGFSIVVDALYIALDNVCQHSGKKIDNRVNITIEYCETKSLISFNVLNEVAAGSRTPERESRLENARIAIQKRIYRERARLDRGSGLCKLAALVMQSDKTSISFGYAEPNHFQLSFDLVYVGFSSAHSQTPLAADTLLSDLEAKIPA